MREKSSKENEGARGFLQADLHSEFKLQFKGKSKLK